MEVKKIKWSDSLEPVLIKVLNDDLSQIKKEVVDGISELWDIPGHCYLITRVELDLSGNPDELVIIAGIGENGKEVVKHFQAVALKHGIKKIRIHSQRKGMGRYLKGLGFGYEETVYRCRL